MEISEFHHIKNAIYIPTKTPLHIKYLANHATGLQLINTQKHQDPTINH